MQRLNFHRLDSQFAVCSPAFVWFGEVHDFSVTNTVPFPRDYEIRDYRLVYTPDFCCDFLPLIDVNERINNERPECVFPYLNIRYWFTRSHPSKGENRIQG